MKNIIFRSILSRYIISYVAVMSVLFAGVAVYMNYSITSSIRTDIEETNSNRLSILRLQHEEKLLSLLSIANQVSLSHFITPFKLEEQPLKAYHLKQLLLPFTTINNFCDQLYVIFNEDEYMYSSATSVSISMYTEKLMSYENVSPGMLQALLRRGDSGISVLPGQNTQSTLTNGTNKVMVTYIMPLRMDGRFHVGNALFLVQDSTYQRMFRDGASELSGLKNMYIFHDQGIVAADRSIDIPDDAVLSAVYGSENDSGENFIHDININGTAYMLFVQNGSFLDMRYVTLIPGETIRLRMTRQQMTVGLVLLMLSIPSGLLTVYFARRHVKPIKELQRSFGAKETSKDDFTSIRNGIEDLMGQNMTLSTRLDESLSARGADFVKNFIKGRYLSRREAITAASKLGLSIDRMYYFVLLVGADNHQPGALDSLAVGQEDVIGCGMEVIAQEQFLFVLFSDTKQSLLSWADTAKTVLSAVDKDAAIAVSNVHEDFSKAGTAYLEANAAYDNRFVMGNEHTLRFSDVSTAARNIEPFTRSYPEGFRKALQFGDADALNDRINELFRILENKKFSMFAFRVIYNDVISAILSKYFSYDDAKVDALQYYDIFTLSGCRHVSDLANILRKLCNEILAKNIPQELTKPQESSVIPRICEYMRQNLTDPSLSMSAIADMHNISSGRLSVDFKEAMGIYPSEYLLELRMEKARELLITTELSIKDVGEAVGYYDASGFIRRFKRHMSVTPAQYRQSMKKSG